MQTNIIIKRRENLCFTADDISSPRICESYDLSPVSQSLEEFSQKIVKKCLAFLPLKYHPSHLWIDLEYKGKIIFSSNGSEEIPISLVMSQQQPSTSRIRMGMHEIEYDLPAFESILAHEMGHMLPEWCFRKAGLVTDEDTVIPYWSKSIYEGVADWIASVITEQTTIGSTQIWFSRDIILSLPLMKRKTRLVEW